MDDKDLVIAVLTHDENILVAITKYTQYLPVWEQVLIWSEKNRKKVQDRKVYGVVYKIEDLT